METGISIPDDLFAEAERYAENQGLSRSELYRRALATYLEKQRDRQTTEQLDRFLALHGAKLAEESAAMWAHVKKVWDESMGDDDW